MLELWAQSCTVSFHGSGALVVLLLSMRDKVYELDLLLDPYGASIRSLGAANSLHLSADTESVHAFNFEG